MSTSQWVRLRTAAWYGDRDLSLELPGDWEVETFWPRTPPPLAPEQIAAALQEPAGQQPLRELAAGRSRPVIVVDDLARPTPAHLVLPLLLRELLEAGIGARDVTIVVGGGSHRPATAEQVLKKVGEAAAGCRLVVHDCGGETVRVGRTSFGTPVLLNPVVAAADLLVGVGGIGPNPSLGFGGGTKLMMGVLGTRSLVALHYGHARVAGTRDPDNDFRRDLDEIAEIAGLRTLVTLLVDANRDVIGAVSGDHRAWYPEAVGFVQEAFAAPGPADADVVIANAYPIDVSLTFAHSMGMAPLSRAAPGASRVLLASCPEGLGHHGLFPFANGPRFERQIHQLRRLSVIRPAQVPDMLAREAERLLAPRRPAAGAQAVGLPAHPTWLHVPGAQPGMFPDEIPGLRLEPVWTDVLQALRREQAGRTPVRVRVYPCASLQWLEEEGGERPDSLGADMAG
jgi:nickel-dependent lactate racemase